MAYSPLAQIGSLRKKLLVNPAVKDTADSHGVATLQMALAWTIRSNHVSSMPKSAQEKHILMNAQAASITLIEEEAAKLDSISPSSVRKMPLDIL